MPDIKLPKGFKLESDSEIKLPAGFKLEGEPVKKKASGVSLPSYSKPFAETDTAKPAVLTDKGKDEYDQRLAEEQKREAELNKRASKALKAYEQAQGKGSSDSIQKTAEAKPEDVLSGEQERSGNRAGYIYNELLSGIGDIASGMGDISIQNTVTNPFISAGDAILNTKTRNTGDSIRDYFGTVTDGLLNIASGLNPSSEDNEQIISDYRENTAPEIAGFLKDKIGADVDKGTEAKYQNEFITSAVGGIARSTPAMLSGSAGLMLQGYASALNSVQQADADNSLDEGTKTIYAGAVGLVNASLEKLGLDRIFKGSTPKAAQAITEKAIAEASKETGGKITGNTLMRIINGEVKDIADNYSKFGIKALNGIVTEGWTGGAQETANVISEKLLNSSTGKSVFDTEDETTWDGFKNTLARIGYSAAQEAVGGGILGTVSGISSISPKRKSAVVSSEASLSKINEEIDNPDISETTREVLVQKKIELQNNIENEVRADIEEQSKFTPEEKADIELLSDETAKLETALADSNLPNDVKEELQTDLEAKNKEIESIYAGASKRPRKKPTPLEELDGHIKSLNELIAKPNQSENSREVNQIILEDALKQREQLINGGQSEANGANTEITEPVQNGETNQTADNTGVPEAGSEVVNNAQDNLPETDLPADDSQSANQESAQESETFTENEQTQSDEQLTAEPSIIGEIKKTTPERLAEIKAKRAMIVKRIKAKAASAYSGFNPEVITDLVELGATYIEEGVVRFKDFADRLKEDYGEDIPSGVIRDIYFDSASRVGYQVRGRKKNQSDFGKKDYISRLDQLKRRLADEQRGFNKGVKEGRIRERERFETWKDIMSTLRDDAVHLIKDAKSDGLFMYDKSGNEVFKITKRLTDAKTPHQMLRALDYAHERFNAIANRKALQASKTARNNSSLGQPFQSQGDVVKITNAAFAIPEENSKRLKAIKPNLWQRFSKRVFDTQQLVLDKLRKEGNLGEIAEAYLKNRKGSSGLAASVSRSASNAVFGDLSLSAKHVIDGIKRSEREILDTMLNMHRVIAIDTRIQNQFNELNVVSAKLEAELKKPTGQRNKHTIDQLQKEVDNLKKSLNDKNVLSYDSGTKQYKLGQYKHTKLNGVNLSSATAKQVLDNIKQQQPEVWDKLNKRAELYQETYKHLLGEQYKNGIISEDLYNELKQYDYIPSRYIQHILANEMSDAAGGFAPKVSNDIKKLTGGSEDATLTNFEAILDTYIHSVYKNIFENKAAFALKKVVEKPGSNIPVKDAPIDHIDKNGEPVYKPAPAGYDFINYFDKGVLKKMLAPIDFAEAWYDRRTIIDNDIAPVFSRFAVNPFKSMITGYNPAFGVFQVFLDSQGALLNTNAYSGYITSAPALLKDYASVSKDVALWVKDGKATPLFQEALNSGVFSDFLSAEGDILNLRNRSVIAKKKLASGIKAGLKKVSIFNEGMEYWTRLAVYKRMRDKLTKQYKKENGAEPTGDAISDILALSAAESRNMIDFSRGGSVVKYLNNYAAYINAAVQGFRSYFANVKKHPFKAMQKAGEVGILGLTALAYSMGDIFGEDDEEKKRRLKLYKSLHGYQRTNYFNIYIGGDDPESIWMRIPKPEQLKPFLNSIEQGYLMAVHGSDFNKDDFYESAQSISPIGNGFDLINRVPPISAYMKYAGNYDAYRNQQIVKREEDTPDFLEGANSPYVGDFYKWIGKKSSELGINNGEGISPARAQEAVSSLYGKTDRNPITNMLSKAVKGSLYAMSGNEEALKEEMPKDALDFIETTTGFKSRMFNKQPKMDYGFIDEIEKDKRDDYIKNFYINKDIQEMVDNSDSMGEAVSSVRDYLVDKVRDGELTRRELESKLDRAKGAFKIKGAPDWYKTVLFEPEVKYKVRYIHEYTKDMSSDELNNTLRSLVKAGAVSGSSLGLIRKELYTLNGGGDNQWRRIN